MSRICFCRFILISHAIYCYLFQTIWVPVLMIIHEDDRSHSNDFSEVKMRSHRRWIGKTAEIVRMVAAQLRLFDLDDG